MLVALYVMVVCMLGLDAAAQSTGSASPAGDPDALFARREEGTSARQAADIWSAQLKADPRAFESAWKLSQARYWLGTHGAESGRRADLEAGMEAARAAIAVEPNRAEGHFWLAANMGALAESFGMGQGIKYRKPIRASLETVLRLDPKFLQGSADRALGRWYFKVPGLFGGSNQKSEEHLRKSLTYNPNSTVSWFFLAETLRTWAERRKRARRCRRCSTRRSIRSGRPKIASGNRKHARCCVDALADAKFNAHATLADLLSTDGRRGRRCGRNRRRLRRISPSGHPESAPSRICVRCISACICVYLRTTIGIRSPMDARLTDSCRTRGRSSCPASPPQPCA